MWSVTLDLGLCTLRYCHFEKQDFVIRNLMRGLCIFVRETDRYNLHANNQSDSQSSRVQPMDGFFKCNS